MTSVSGVIQVLSSHNLGMPVKSCRNANSRRAMTVKTDLEPEEESHQVTVALEIRVSSLGGLFRSFTGGVDPEKLPGGSPPSHLHREHPVAPSCLTGPCEEAPGTPW